MQLRMIRLIRPVLLYLRETLRGRPVLHNVSNKGSLRLCRIISPENLRVNKDTNYVRLVQRVVFQACFSRSWRVHTIRRFSMVAVLSLENGRSWLKRSLSFAPHRTQRPLSRLQTSSL